MTHSLNPNKHLQHCEQLTQDFCRQLMQQCWHLLDDQLAEQGRQITDEEARNQHNLQMQDARFKAEQVGASISRHNQQNFAGFRELLPLATEAAHKGLTSASPARQQDSLAINRVIQDSLHKQQPALRQLNQRLALLRGGQRCEDRDNPLAPAALCLAFQYAVRHADIDARLRLLLYDIFGGLLSEQIDRFYHKVNHYLISNGILPNLLPSKRSISNILGRPGGSSPTTQESPVQAQTEQRLAQVNSLLRSQLKLSAAIRNTIGHMDSSPDELYLDACSLLQRQIAEHVNFNRDQLIDPQSTKRQYYKYLLAQTRQCKTGLDADKLGAIELLTRFFATLTGDSNLPLELRGLLSFLHAPCIKLVIENDQFFNSDQHPARQLIDLMLESGSRWLLSQAEDESLVEAMRAAVSAIACDHTHSVSSFATELLEFRQCLAHIQQQAERCEQREIRGQAGMESLDLARSRARQQVQEVMSQYSVTGEIHERLSGSCIDFLAFVLLQHGEGRHWVQAQHLLKGIALSVQGQLPRQQLVQFQRGQQRLYNAVRRGLEESGYQGMLANDLLASLNLAQQQLIEQIAATDAPLRNPGKVRPGYGFHLLNQLEIGHWYHFHDRPRSGPILLKLAWRSAGWTRVLFVDASGAKRRLEYADTLALSLQRKQVRSLGAEPTQSVEAALDTILHQLRLDALRQRFSQQRPRAGRPELKIC